MYAFYTLYAFRLLAALPDVKTSGKGLPDGPELRQSICLIARPIKVTLSLTTSTQAVLCILPYLYEGVKRPPIGM